MKKTLQLVWLLLLAAVGFAQNLTTVTATKIQKAGVLLPSGKIYFQATDGSDNPISFQVGGGGQAVNYPYCGVVVSGTITSACTGGTFQVANPGTTAPLNLNYRVTVTDGTRTLLTYPGVQFFGATFNFDNYVPSSNLPLGSSVPFLTVGTEFLTNYADVTEIPNPGNPATGLERWYANSSTHQLSCLTSTGSNCAPGGGSGAFNGGSGSSFQDAALITQPANPTAGNARLYVDSGTNKLSCLLPTGASCNPTSSPGGGNTLVQYNNNGQFGAIAEAHLGAVLIDQGPGQPPAFADPLVQGLNAEGSTATNNPVNVGGFDTAGTPAIHGVKVLNSAPGGTEYGFVVRVAGTPAVSISGTPSVAISGTPTVTANLGTLNGVALDASVTGLEVAQGSTSSGQKGILNLGAVTTAAPTYTTGQSSALSLDTSGNLRTIATISGTPAVTISGTPSVSISGTPTVTANLGTLNGAALDASVTGLEVAQGSTTSGQKGILGLAAVTTSAPTYTTAQSAPLSVDTAGNLRTLATISGSPSVTIQSNASVNLNQIAGSAAATAATGVLKIGIVGNTGVALDGAQGAAAPANGLVTSGVFNTAAPSLTNGQMSQVQMDANGNIKVAIAAGGGSGGTASTFGAAFPGTGTAIGFQPDGGGNMKAGLVDASGFMEVNCKAGCTSASDNTTGSTAISNGTTNSTITLTMAGENSATFQLQSGGTLIATVTPQCSFDGGTTFPVNGIIQDPVTGQISLTATIASAQATTDYPVVCPQGASTIQLKATSYTSGTANFLARSTINNGPRLLMGLVTSSAPTYSNNTFNGISLDTSGNIRTLATISGTPSVSISGTPTVTANIGTTNGLALDASVTGLEVAQGSTTSGQKGMLMQGAVTTAPPSYTTAQSSPLSLDTSGNLRTSVLNTVTVTGTVTTTPPANASTNLTQINGTAANTAAAGTLLVGLADGAGNKLTTNSSTFTAKFALDENLLGTLGTAFSTPGFVDIKGADGNVFVRQATAANLNAQVVGNVASGSTDSGNGVKTSGVFSTTQPTVTNGQRVDFQASNRGELLIAKGVSGFTIDNTSFQATQATAANLNAQVQGNVASGSADSGNPDKIGGVFNTTQPTATTGQRIDAQMTARGELLVAPGVSGFSIANTGFNVNNSPTVVQGNKGSNAQAWWTEIGDTTNGPVAVKAASTSAVVADPSLVVQISPNQAAFPVTATISGSPTVVQGNAGSNAQAWWMRIGDATNGPVAVKPASTGAAAADPSLVVQISPNQATFPVTATIAGTATTSSTAATSATATLQSAATANGNGSAISVDGMGSAAVTVNCASCSGGTTINFEATQDGANFTPILAFNAATGSTSTTTTTAGLSFYQLSVTGFKQLRTRISAYSAGTITATATADPMPYNPLQTSAAGGTSSSFGSAFPASGTAIGAKNGTNMVNLTADASNNLMVNCQAGCSGSSFADNSAFTIGTTNITNIGGVFNDGVAAVTSGNSAALRLTPYRAVHENLRGASGVELGTLGNPLITTSPSIQALDNAVGSAWPGLAPTGDFVIGGVYSSIPPVLTPKQQVPLQLDRYGRLITAPPQSLPPVQITTDGQSTVGTPVKPLYTANVPATLPASYHATTGATGFAAASSATDIFSITGSSTSGVSILVTRIFASCTQTTAGMFALQLIKRSTADSAGTNITETPDDTRFGPSGATVAQYTANPASLGSAVGTVDSWQGGCSASGTAGANDIYIFDGRQKPIILHGINDQLAINLNSATLTGNKFTITVEYMAVAGL